jgi:hypothetical protein
LARRWRIRPNIGKLSLRGADLNHAAVTRKLKEWLRLRVLDDLFPLAQGLADKHGLQLRGMFVKS